MTSRGRVMAGLAIVLVAIVVAGAIVVRRGLAPDWLRQRAETALTAALGTPVRIGAVSISFLPRPAVIGRDISTGATSGTPSSGLTLERIRLVPRLGSLFGSAPEVESVDLEGLVIVARRAADGTWERPFGSGSGRGGAMAAATTAATLRQIRLSRGAFRVVQDGRASSVTPGIESIRATLQVDGGAVTIAGLAGAVGESVVRGEGRVDGTGLALNLTLASLRDEDVPTMLSLLGVSAPGPVSIAGDDLIHADVRVGPDGALGATGRLTASRLSVGGVALTDVRAPFRYAAGTLHVEPANVTLFDGRFEGALVLDPRTAPTSWTVRGQATNVDVAALLPATTSAGARLEGRAAARVDIRGRAGDGWDRTLRGAVDVDVTRGVIRDFPLLATLSRALRIAETAGRDTTFETLALPLSLQEGQATSDGITLVATEVAVKAGGVMTADRRLDLDALAVFTPEKSREIIRSVHEMSGLRNARSEVEVPFDIGGTLAEPAINVDLGSILRTTLQKELRRQIERRLKGLGGLFGRKPGS